MLTTHIYRYTFATCALEDVKALSRDLGHKSVAFTMQHYRSPDLNFLREQMDFIDQVQETGKDKLFAAAARVNLPVPQPVIVILKHNLTAILEISHKETYN